MSEYIEADQYIDQVDQYEQTYPELYVGEDDEPELDIDYEG